MNAPDRANKPTISVVVPVRNGVPYIRRTIASIRNSSLGEFNLEIIVVDNHSSDGTAEVIKEFSDMNIKLVRPPKPLYIHENWTLAINSASGEYIKLVCADDIIDEECLVSQFQILSDPKNCEVSAVFGTRSLIDEFDNFVWQARTIDLPAGSIDGERVLKAIARAGTNILGEPLTALFRAEAIKNAMPWPSTHPYMLDLGGYLPILLEKNVFISNQHCGSYRVHKDTLSNSLSLSQAKQFVDFMLELPMDFGRWTILLMRLKAGIQQRKRRLFYKLMSSDNGRKVMIKMTGILNAEVK
jgi:glycosyltransferase involved in cell wall biosynthesis